MRRSLLTKGLVLALAAGVILPTVALAKNTKTKAPKKLTNIVSSEKADRNTIGKFNSNKENKKLYHVNGTVSAVSATSISVDVLTDDNANSNANTNAALVKTTYTFAVDASTLVVRKYRGKATIGEVAVGDKVMVWATKLTDGTAKLIWDKTLWYVSQTGKVSDLNATDKTFRLTITRKGVEYYTTVKTTDATTYLMGETAKTFADLANGQTVTVKGSWNNVGKFIMAKKITIAS